MANSNKAPEENPAVKNSSSSVVQVDSIYIELPLTEPKMKMDIRCSCQNGFSIRGYAASKRGSTPDVSSIYPPGRELPLMEVPSFRYWRCCTCAGFEEDATGGAPEVNIADVQYLGTLEQGLPAAADANEETRAASNREDMQQDPTDPTNEIADAIRLSLSLSPPTIPEATPHTLVPTTVTGATEAPAEELNAGAIVLQHQPEENNAAEDPPRKTDRTEVVEQSSGSHKRKRKHRSLADILGVKQRSKASEVERALDALLASKAVYEGLQRSRRKRPASHQEEEVPVEKPSKRDKGKAIVTDDEDTDVRVVQPRGEGLFIGSKEERQRNRTDVAPAPSRKKAKQALTLGISENVAKLIRELPSPPAATILESQQPDQNDAGLPSGDTAHSKQLGLDLSLGTFPKKSHQQSSGAKGEKIVTQNGGSNPGSHLQSDRSSKKGSLDLNEAAAHTSAIPFQEKMDFLQLGPKEKSSDQENQEETDSRTDDIPMDIVELLAKQQFERTKSDAGHSPVAHGSSDSSRGFRDVEMVGTSHWMRGFTGQPKFPAVGAQVASVPSSKASSLSLSQPRSSLPTLESLRSVLTNNPPSHGLNQHMSSAATGRGGAQYPNNLFPPPPSSLGFGFGGQQKKDGQHHRGKTISDIKADELKKTREAASRFSFYKPGSSAAGSNGAGAYESYGNDSIPALQLMSLMDGGSSGTGPSAGSSRIPSRPISPSVNPRFSKDARRDFLSGSMFSGQIHHKELMPNPPISFQALRPHSSALPANLSFRTPEVDMARNSLQHKAGPSSGVRPELYIPYLHDPRVRARSLAPKNNRTAADSNRPVAETATVPAVAARTGTGRHVSADGVCRTNRNPADFSLPEPCNVYTISSKDLSKKRKKYSKRVQTANAAAAAAVGDATNKGQQQQQGSTSLGKPSAAGYATNKEQQQQQGSTSQGKPAAAGDATNKGQQQGSTSQEKPADVHPKVGSS